MKTILMILVHLSLALSCSNEVDFKDSLYSCKFFMNYNDTQCSAFQFNSCTYTKCILYSTGRSKSCLEYKDFLINNWKSCTFECCDSSVVYAQTSYSINQCQNYITQTYKISMAIVGGIIGGVVLFVIIVLWCRLWCKDKCPDWCYCNCRQCCLKFNANSEGQTNPPEKPNSNNQLEEPSDQIHKQQNNQQLPSFSFNHNEYELPQTFFDLQPNSFHDNQAKSKRAQEKYNQIKQYIPQQQQKQHRQKNLEEKGPPHLTRLCGICFQLKPNLLTDCRHSFHSECFHESMRDAVICTVCGNRSFQTLKVFCLNCSSNYFDFPFENLANYLKYQCKQCKKDNIEKIEVSFQREEVNY